MGQYYMAIILGEKPADENEQEIIRAFMEVFISGGGMKLMEHSYIQNSFVNTFEYQLTKNGMFYKSRVVWGGDYADNEQGIDKNLHHLTNDFPDKNLTTKLTNEDIKSAKDYPYIINHTKKQFVDKQKCSLIHPLPLLTAEGNGRGGGDYRGKNEKLVGIWARDVLSVEKEKPDDYKELICNFEE
jgi:hypothetical protein